MKVLLCLLASLAAAAAQSCPPEDLVYYPDSQQCDKYVECRNGVARDLLCPDGLLFDDTVDNGAYPCKYRPEVDCGSRGRTQNPQPTEFCGNQWGYFGSGNSADCGYFYNCVDGFAHKITCPAGLAFSSATYRCEWADESPDCDAEAFLGFACPESGAFDQILLRGHPKFRSPRDCREFFLCVGKSPRLQFCQLGLVFDELTGSCEEPENVQGCQNYYPPEELALYREQRERYRIAEERRQAELQSLRESLTPRN
ncbi:protein obstructor-E-like [Panulirus ornatus]|uniref:protein obstructor-E-like n=1 Tax=Panulirus ornatus TaxID=150431 RepID=UPI003A856A11